MSASNPAVLPALESSRAEAVRSAVPSQTSQAVITKAPQLIWHYTHDRSFFQIMKDRRIPSANPFIPAGELPVIWSFTNDHLSTHPHNKCEFMFVGQYKLLDLRVMVTEKLPVFRIGVDPGTPSFRWTDAAYFSDTDRKVVQGLVPAAKDMGARPSRWRGVLGPVPWKKWRAVHTVKNGKWVSVFE